MKLTEWSWAELSWISVALISKTTTTTTLYVWRKIEPSWYGEKERNMLRFEFYCVLIKCYFYINLPQYSTMNCLKRKCVDRECSAYSHRGWHNYGLQRWQHYLCIVSSNFCPEPSHLELSSDLSTHLVFFPDLIVRAYKHGHFYWVDGRRYCGCCLRSFLSNRSWHIIGLARSFCCLLVDHYWIEYVQ